MKQAVREEFFLFSSFFKEYKILLITDGSDYSLNFIIPYYIVVKSAD